MVVALSVFLTWVFNHTGGSIFVAITAHASINTVEVAVAPLFSAVGYSNLLLAGALSIGVLALLAALVTRGRLGWEAQPDPA